MEIEIWWGWMALAAIFVFVEVFRKGSVFLWLAFGAASAGVLALLHIPASGQIAVFINISGILILLERRFSERYTFKKTSSPPEKAAESLADPGDGDNGQNTFIRQGPIWQIRYAGVSYTVKHSIGLTHIRNLIIKTGEWIHCSELKRLSADPFPDSGYEPYRAMSEEQIERENLHIEDHGNPETLISGMSLKKIRKLRETLIERKVSNDFNSPEDRIDQLNTLDFIEKYLGSTTDIKGRPRKILDREDTDRKAVSAAINRCRNNLKKNREIYIHFKSFIQAEGNAFRYLPDRPVDWKIE